MDESSQTDPPRRVSAWRIAGQATWIAVGVNVLAFVVLGPVAVWKFQLPLVQIVEASLMYSALCSVYLVAETLLFFHFRVRSEWFGAVIGIAFGAAIVLIWTLVWSAPFDPKRLATGVIGGFAIGRANVRWLNRWTREAAAPL